MDAATAAIVGSSITGGVAVAVGVAAPWFTARHARKARQLDLMREVYVNATEGFIAIAAINNADDRRRAHLHVINALAQIRMVGSDEAGDSYMVISDEIGAVIKRLATARTIDDAYPADKRAVVEAEMKRFRAIARRDLETDDAGWMRRLSRSTRRRLKRGKTASS